MYKHIYVHRFYKSDHGSGEWQLITTMHDDDDGWSLCVFQFQGTVRLASNFYLNFLLCWRFPSDLLDLFVMLSFQVFPIKKEVLHPQDEMERHITDLIKKVF
jgi:hypothetical protein